ncbi:hypothetical protein F5Y11DRAFT_335235 [Daldinia sp. FL1419]|nr:hypothetical protein F5Y11DRAFT_335235 [Daldinia sp. FL1419]
MNWYRGSTVIVEPTPARSEGPGKKLRRKLQKIGAPQRWYKPNDQNDRNDHKDAKKSGATITNANNKVVPAAPDRDDGKWLEQLRKSGSLCRGQAPVQPVEKPLRHSMQVIPEFAHLAVDDTKPVRHLDRRASCANPPSASSVSRRYAKTPVHHIGQLEGHSRREQTAAHRISSVEEIAESYRALLESSCAILNDTNQVQPLRLGESYRASLDNQAAREEITQDFSEALYVRSSPRSDDGTLVASEADSVSFKPSFTPEIPSPRELCPQTAVIPPPRRATPGSPSLQICVDLLGQELSSAARGSAFRPNAETSSLQVWVMIEAYERLREKISDMRLGEDQEKSLDTMLDTWIQALYAVHDRMTGNDGHESESDYGD